MKTRAIVERGKDGMFSIFAPDLKSGLWGEGKTVMEAMVDFENSTKELRECYAENAYMTNELEDVEFEFFWDIASVLNHFDWINLSKFANRHRFSTSLLHHYKSSAYISDEQARKILDALRDDAMEILSINVRDTSQKRASSQSVVSRSHSSTSGHVVI